MFHKKFAVIGILLILVAIVAMIGIGVWLGSNIGGSSASKVGASPYSAVYLANGDMYFGLLSWFPKPHLSNVWLIQRTVDKNNQQQVGVAQFTKAFWAPMDEISLNPSQIVWWTRLQNSSQLVQAMENPSLLQQQQQAQQQTPADTGTTASKNSPSSQTPAGK